MLETDPGAGALLHPKRTNSDAHRRNADGSVMLQFATSNICWYGVISVGTPPVDFSGLSLPSRVILAEWDVIVDFDTGSADLVLPTPSCNTTCNGHTLYDPARSSTAVDKNNIFMFSYGDGSYITGEQYADTVSVAGYTVCLRLLPVPVNQAWAQGT